MPDTAASAAAPNGAIYLCREYLIIGDPMWLDTWGGLEPDPAMSIAVRAERVSNQLGSPADLSVPAMSIAVRAERVSNQLGSPADLSVGVK